MIPDFVIARRNDEAIQKIDKTGLLRRKRLAMTKDVQLLFIKNIEI